MPEKKKTGPPSLEELHGEAFVDFRFRMPQSQHDYLKSQSTKEHITMAELLRRFIAAAMAQDGPPRAIP